VEQFSKVFVTAIILLLNHNAVVMVRWLWNCNSQKYGKLSCLLVPLVWW